MLIVPLLVLTPLYLRLEPGHRLRRRLMATDRLPARRRGGDALAQRPARPRRRRARARCSPTAATSGRARCSPRSAARSRCSRSSSSPAATSSRSSSGRASRRAAAPRPRTSRSTASSRTILHSHPLFGLGLNNFSVYYEFVTGKTNWGPHSFYVALLVETGLVGTALFALFLVWVFLPARRRARARPAR